MNQAGLTWEQIDRVLLVGGATRMPMVVEMLRRVTGKEPDRSVSPDEVVAHGAALYAEMLMGGGSGSSQTAVQAGQRQFAQPGRGRLRQETCGRRSTPC